MEQPKSGLNLTEMLKVGKITAADVKRFRAAEKAKKLADKVNKDKK